MPDQMGNPTYQDILDMIAAQYAAEGGGFMGLDPYAPSGGFPSPPMPNGKMPQYRTQGSGYVSDGTVRDYVGMALPNTDKFSPDALINADPALKPLIARAVAEADQDPYAAYATFDDPEYRQALVQMALNESGYQNPNGGGSTFNPAALKGMDEDGDGKVDEGKAWTIEDVIADQGGMPGNTVTGTGFIDPLTGREFQQRDTYANVLRQKMGAYEGALDNFFTQGAPTIERNLNDITTAADAFGGMPFPSRAGAEDFSYAGAGPGFAGGGGGGERPMSRHEWQNMYTRMMQEDARAQAGVNVGAPAQRYDGRRKGGGKPKMTAQEMKARQFGARSSWDR